MYECRKGGFVRVAECGQCDDLCMPYNKFSRSSFFFLLPSIPKFEISAIPPMRPLTDLFHLPKMIVGSCPRRADRCTFLVYFLSVD